MDNFGDFVSIPHLYWPIAFLWGYFSTEHNLEEKELNLKYLKLSKLMTNYAKCVQKFFI